MSATAEFAWKEHSVVIATLPLTPETSVWILQQARRDEQWREYLNTDLFGPRVILS